MSGQLAVARVAVLERKPSRSARAGGPCAEQVRIVGLGEVDDAPVVAEVHRLELRVAVDPEAADHEPLEVAGEEVGQPERRRLLVGQAGEVGAAGEELVAMGAGQPLHALLGEDRVEQAAGAAVGVGDEDPLVAVAPALTDPSPDARRDAAGPVVELGRQAGDVDVRQRPGQLDQFARQRPAPDDEDRGAPALGPWAVADQRASGGRAATPILAGPPWLGPLAGPFGGGPPSAERFEGRLASLLGPPGGPRPRAGAARLAQAAARRSSIRRRAVSAATPASRQYASAPTAIPNSSLSGAPPTRTM